MAKQKIGITLNDETLQVLMKECSKLGLTKSQFISLLINQYKQNNLAKKGV